jgi:hypothetical protein
MSLLIVVCYSISFKMIDCVSNKWTVTTEIGSNANSNDIFLTCFAAYFKHLNRYLGHVLINSTTFSPCTPLSANFKSNISFYILTAYLCGSLVWC